MSHAFGAVFDNPGLIVACIIGDGEAETGPIATAWHANKMLDPIGDGTVLPILHLNGFKISNPTVLSRIEPEELEQFLRGCGWTPYFVEGDDPQAMHRLTSDTLDLVVADIAPIGADARASIKSPRPRRLMIVLRPPKGWTGPKTVDGLKNEGTFRAHQVPILVDAAHPGLAIIAGECLAEKDKMPRGRPESLDIGRVVSAGPLRAAIFDVDGVLLASPHERAWREALVGFADPVSFTTAVYQAIVAGKPRLDGACAALKALGVPDAGRQAGDYALCKQARLEALIAGGEVSAFPDALRFVLAVAALGWPMAVASSSKNARAMLRLIRVPDGRSLLDLFAVDVCGCDLRHGKPDPEIFQIAAEELHMNPDRCFVAEDAPAGVEAARAGGMAPLGVARLDDAAGLKAARADLVVASLDDVDLGALSDGRLCRHAT